MIPVDPKYKEGIWDFPSKDIDPKLKGDKYCMQNGIAIYSLFCRNMTAWGFNEVKKFTTNRSYSTGSQDVDQYKSWLLNNETEDSGSSTTPVSVDSWDSMPLSRVSKREGWANILWKNLSPAPSIMNQLHGQFDKQDFDLYVNTIDADSRGLAEDEKYRKMVEAKFSDWQIEYKRKAGIPVDEEVIYPRTQEEFDMFEAEDGFKLAVATSMQKLLRHSFDISKWDTVIRKKIIDDLVTLGYGATRDYFDSEEGKWKVKYLDPAFLVAQYSNEFDYSDSEYFGYLTYWTISNLRNKLPQCEEHKLKALAQNNGGKNGNPDDSYITKGGGWTRNSDLDPNTNGYFYDSFKIPVFESV